MPVAVRACVPCGMRRRPRVRRKSSDGQPRWLPPRGARYVEHGGRRAGEEVALRRQGPAITVSGEVVAVDSLDHADEPV